MKNEITYSSELDITGVLINIENKVGDYGGYSLIRVKTGKAGLSQVTVALGPKLARLVDDGDLGSWVNVKASFNTQGDRDQYHRLTGYYIKML